MLSKIKKSTMRLFELRNSKLEKALDKQLILLAYAQSKVNKDLAQIDDLSEVEFSVFSQWGEDGIIDWIISQVPNIPKTFIEFGVENYLESNTRFILKSRNWQGLVIDGSEINIQEIKRQDIYWKYNLTAKCAFVDKNNINQLLGDSCLNGEIGLLSIDIDGNDYWVWQAITCVTPSIVVVEYNAVLGDVEPVSIPYRSDFVRTKAHHSNLYFGASLPALIQLGREKGYTFIGTSSSGVNAFFIRDDLAPGVVSKICNISAYPSLFREARGPSGQLLFINGRNRSEMIFDKPLVNTITNKDTSLREIREIYSEQWSLAKRRLF